jgi:hypothetical protein
MRGGLQKNGLRVWAWVGLPLSAAGLVVLVWAAIAHRPHPSGSLDYGSLAVSVGTLILAVFTLGSVLLGWQALSDTRADIQVSREALKISQKEMEAAQRPVLLPLMSDDQRWHFRIHEWGTNVVARPQVGGPDGRLLIPIRNVGAGVALNVIILMVGRTDGFGWSEPWGNQPHTGYHVAIAVDDAAPIIIEQHPPIGGVPAMELAILYRDLAGIGWITYTRYTRGGEDGGRGWFLDADIDRAPDDCLTDDQLILSGLAHFQPLVPPAEAPPITRTWSR